MENNENTENISVIKNYVAPLSLMIILPILLILLLKNTQQSPPKIYIQILSHYWF